MRLVAYVGTSSELPSWLRSAFPGRVLRPVSLDAADELARDGMMHVLLVDLFAFERRTIAWLAALKARHADLVTLAYLAADRDLGTRAFGLARAGVDELLVAGIEDHPRHVAEVLRHAAIRTVARVVERWAAPLPACLAAPDLERTVGCIHLLKTPGALARSLGIVAPRLESEVHHADIFRPRTLLAHLRLLWAARVLGDSDETIERIALEELDYTSLTAFGNACRHLWGASPRQVRTGGGLRFGAERFRLAVQVWRSRQGENHRGARGYRGQPSSPPAVQTPNRRRLTNGAMA